MIAIYTPRRWGKFAEGFQQVPWEGHFRSYEERHGVFVPTEGEVGWYVDGSYQPVWKGTISAFQLGPDVAELPAVGAANAPRTHKPVNTSREARVTWTKAGVLPSWRANSRIAG